MKIRPRLEKPWKEKRKVGQNSVRDKRGFTLIEAVVSVALIGMVSLGFVAIVGGYTGVAKAGREHSEASAELSSFAEGAQLPVGAVEKSLGNIELNLSNDNDGVKSEACPDSDSLRISLEELELSYPEDGQKGTYRYYRP